MARYRPATTISTGALEHIFPQTFVIIDDPILDRYPVNRRDLLEFFERFSHSSSTHWHHEDLAAQLLEHEGRLKFR